MYYGMSFIDIEIAFMKVCHFVYYLLSFDK